MQEVSTRLGVPLSCVVPVKNYIEELDPNCNILLLSAIQQMLRFADNYFDEISDQLSNTEAREQWESTELFKFPYQWVRLTWGEAAQTIPQKRVTVEIWADTDVQNSLASSCFFSLFFVVIHFFFLWKSIISVKQIYETTLNTPLIHINKTFFEKKKNSVKSHFCQGQLGILDQEADSGADNN